MAGIPDNEIERLKKEVALERLVLGFGVELKRHGAELLGRCPFAKYLVASRPKLVSEPDDKTVFLSNAGEPFSLDHLSDLVRTYVDASGIGKRGACHLFRHTMATLMLEGGADIRFIQAMLGHADLKTTQIYTHVAIRQFQEIHRATHPAKLKREVLDPLAEEDDE